MTAADVARAEALQKNRANPHLRAQEREEENSGISEGTSDALALAEGVMEAGANGGDALLQVVVHLEDKPFDFTRLRPLRAARQQKEFKKVVEERKRQLEPSQGSVTALIESLGGMLVASGHGLIEVRMPSQSAPKPARRPVGITRRL